MNSPEVWRKDFLEPAIAALAKMKVAKFVGEVADASRFESEYNGYMNKLAHMDENAAKALESEVANAANDLFEANRAKLMAIKHADEPISLSHGTKWKDHKYIRIENGRYIYPDDEKIKNSKEKKYVVLRKEAYKKSNDANIAAVAGGHSSENDIAAAITRSQASGMRRTADLLEAQMNEQKRREQENKKETENSQKTLEDIRNEIKTKSQQMWNDVLRISNDYSDPSVEATEFEADTGVPKRYVIKSQGKLVYDTGNFLLDYEDWNYKTVKHSFESFLAHALDTSIDDYIEHHGILGQKWGVRRYQNTDGTLTSAGKKRYSQSELDEIAEASRKHGIIGGFIKRHQIKKRRGLSDSDQYDDDDYDLPKTNVEKVLDRKLNKNPNSKEKTLSIENADLLKVTSPRQMSNREKDAAELGIKALKKMGRDDGEINDGKREWFLYEDQTIGLGTVADLCRQGKSKAQIKALAKEASEAPDDKYYDHFDLADLSGTPYLDKYIDACQAVMKENK